MKYLGEEKLNEILRLHGDDYRRAEPFPHIVIDRFVDETALSRVVDEFERLGSEWIYYHHFNEKKRGFNRVGDMGPVTRAFLEDFGSPAFVRFLENLTGIRGLLWDPDLDGGGLHEMKRGGFLNMHVDFKSHTVRKNWSRQVNLLLFLNKDWHDDYNGCLELWDKDMKRRVHKIKPVFNRCVVFTTSAISFHGVPDPVLCPEDRSRKSMALYYFRDEKQECRLAPTHYRPRPSDPLLSKILVFLDRKAVAVYSAAKRHLRLSDTAITRILRFFK